GVTRPITLGPQRHLRCRVSRLPAARTVHRQQERPVTDPAPPRRGATRPSCPRPGPGVPGRLPPAPADGRALDRLAGGRTEPAVAIPRNRSQRSVATPPRRRAQPAPPTQPRPRPHQ